MVRVALVSLSLFAGIGIVAAPVASADPPYKNCTEAHQDGRYDIPQGDPAYRSKLDRDGDGIACES